MSRIFFLCLSLVSALCIGAASSIGAAEVWQLSCEGQDFLHDRVWLEVDSVNKAILLNKDVIGPAMGRLMLPGLSAPLTVIQKWQMTGVERVAGELVFTGKEEIYEGEIQLRGGLAAAPAGSDGPGLQMVAKINSRNRDIYVDPYRGLELTCRQLAR